MMVADGTQQSGQSQIPPMYFASFSAISIGDRSVVILPSNITLRVSTLECTINTPLTINFGGVLRNTQVNAELASRSVPFIVNCGQSSNFIDANINVQLRALTGLFGGAPTRLALSQGGGYITGEIDNGVTGSGACTETNGLRFDNTPVKIGSINRAQSSVTTSNQLTWRLCSGGSSLPSGAVTASTEMLVTFN
ncbi:adhesin [Serratia oryzae]|uniref:adhesin n=1 Tax=Serratia oryzae TaxID=2034155 RepID=UPI001FC92BB4|nr:adhesin [Serratia oryzae]